MNFHSDNWAGAHRAISQNLLHHSEGLAAAYGSSDLDQKVGVTFNEIFEREVAVFFTATGTAANSLALAATNRPGGVCLCHSEAHIVTSECGAPEYLTGGARLKPIAGEAGKINPAKLRQELAHYHPDAIHVGQVMAVSLTQATEVGTLYSADEIAEIGEICREHALPLHMDGARFANAIAALDITPAEMTWKLGVDLLSFGGTKNGCWCAEALVSFNPKHATELPYLRKRAAQLFSKTRFVAAQFEAYFGENLWLDLAQKANSQAARLSQIIAAQRDIRLAYPCQANEVFLITSKPRAQALADAGVGYHTWPAPADRAEELAEDEVMLRLVTNFATTAQDITEFEAALSDH